MKAIMIMFDTLSRRYLPNYGNDWVKMPNFERLGEKTVTMDNFYVGSLPCMPARRELHTGRVNFLHRGWSPLEPFDDSMPEILKNNNVYTHLITDHQHYWEDGGATYHNRYNSYEFIRGQEGDLWKGVVKDPEDMPEHINHMPGFMKEIRRHDFINRKYMIEDEDYPQAQCFNKGLEFLEKNKDADNWFLQIESFDPHEPFCVPDRFKEMYKDEFEGEFDWPGYGNSGSDSEEKIKHGRHMYAALMSMCDEYLGKVIDFMDDNNMWDDTMLIVNTDHGFLMGEKEWWGKNIMPNYNEVAHTPFFIWDPRTKIKNERRQSLSQTIDIAPTILDYFEQEIPKDMEGKILKDVVKTDSKIRDYGLYGIFGGHVNVTDGKYTYMRSCDTFGNGDIFEYTLMPMDMRGMKSTKILEKAQLSKPFNFTKGVPLLKMKPSMAMINPYLTGHMLFDLKNDPYQQNAIDNFEIESEMCKAIVELMVKNDAPKEQFERIGLSSSEEITAEQLKENKIRREEDENRLFEMLGMEIEDDAKNPFLSLASNVPKDFLEGFVGGFKKMLEQKNVDVVTINEVVEFMKLQMPPQFASFAGMLIKSSSRRK